MKTPLLLSILIFILLLVPKIAFGQQDTVISVAFMTRDKNLWPDYRANKTSLDRLANFIKRNPQSKIFLNVTCTSHDTPAENLATARERLLAVRAQMAQRFPLDKYLQTSKISTNPVAGRTDIAVIVVKMPRVETPTTPQTQTPTHIAQKPAPAVDTTTPKPEIVIAATVIQPATSVEPVTPTATIVEPTKPLEMEIPVKTEVGDVQQNPEEMEKPIIFTDDEIRSLINQADSFVETPKFTIPISPDAPKEMPLIEAPNTYTPSQNLLPPVKYLEVIREKKSRRNRK